MGGKSSKSTVDIVIPFEDIAYADASSDVPALLKEAQDVLVRLQGFKGCGEYIREAITNPNPQTEEAAWAAVVPSVEILKGFYEFSLKVEKATAKVLADCCVGTNPVDNLKNKEMHPLFKQLAELFDFTLRFDDAKMTNPAIQNDFSYYRRMLNRMRLSNRTKDSGVIVNDEMANSMSLFFAYPTPMMNCLIKTTNNIPQDFNVSMDNVSKFLATFVNICHQMVSHGKFKNDSTNMVCLRFVTGGIILYDHVSVRGAFHKRSPIQVKNAVAVLKNFKAEPTDSLVNALRFNTMHLTDADTPQPIKAVLA